MGYYINPAVGEKEEFLSRCGKEVSLKEWLAFSKPDSLYAAVCLIKNPVFSAAGIAYSVAEAEAFTSALDMRPKRFFLVPWEQVIQHGGISNETAARLQGKKS